MLALAFATASHAGAFAPLPGRSCDTVSHPGRPGRPCLRLSRILGALGGHACDSLALWAPWAALFANVSDSGRLGRPSLRLSRILGALGGYVCHCLALWAPRAPGQDNLNFQHKSGANFLCLGSRAIKRVSSLILSLFENHRLYTPLNRFLN